MAELCIFVYQQERKTAQYTGGTPFSKAVFVQSCWFLAAFYFTWIPYLTLQYLVSGRLCNCCILQIIIGCLILVLLQQWASGKAFYSYGFILYAASSIPLQGFWNWLVYIRRNQFFEETRKYIAKQLSTLGHFLLPRRYNTGPSFGATLSSTDRRSDLRNGDAASATDSDQQ